MRIRKYIYGKKRKIVALAVTSAMVCGLALTGCGSSGSETAADAGNAMSQAPSDIKSVQYMLDAVESSIDTGDMFTERDLAGTYDESEAVYVELSGDSVRITDSDGETQTVSLSSSDDADETYADDSIEIDGSQIVIKTAGIYVISGELTNGTITVDAGDEDKVQLVLAGADISAESYAAIYAKNADKVFVTLAEDSENTLATSGEYVQTDDNNVDAVIFSKCDLVLNGTGSLDVMAEAGHGIVSKDDLKVTDGNYRIDTPDHALNGKDSVRIAGGTFELICDEDGIHAGNDEQTDGYVYIEGGDFTISVGDDGIHAEGVVYITDGDIDITQSYEGIEGYKVLVAGGDIDIVSSDDGFNAAGGSSTESGDSFLPASEDRGMGGGNGADGADSDSLTTPPEMPNGEDTQVNNSQMTPPANPGGDNGRPQGNPSGTDQGGSADSTEDGAAADTGSSLSGYQVMTPGGDMDSDADAYLVITGGSITVNADGDGLDSNGYLGISGGEIYVLGPSNDGNGALDCGISAAITGGSIIAVGGSGMAQGFGENSSQCSALVAFDSWIEAGETITLTDSDGNVLLTYEADKTFDSVVISCSAMTQDGEYTVTAGSESVTFAMDGVTYSNKSGMQGGMGQATPPNGDAGGADGATPPNSDTDESGEAPSNGDIGSTSESMSI